MAIDLPPVMPPQLASQQEIQQSGQHAGAVQSRVIDGVELRVLGNTLLSAEQVNAVLAEAKVPSDAITGLSHRYYSAGHLLVSLRYFRSGNTVTVLVSQSQIKGLRGDAGITGHFESLVGDPDLTLAEFDRARVLADLKADRSGVDYTISYEQHFDDQIILNFHARPRPEHRPGQVTAEVNNRGSRFLGRYFGSLGWRQQFANGTEASMAAETAFPDLGEAEDGEQYYQFAVGVDHPFSLGLYGLEFSHLAYERQPRVVLDNGGLGGLCLPPLISCQGQTATAQVDAEISQLALRGEQVLYSNPVQRLNLFQRLEHIDSELKLADGEGTLLNESYQVASVGLRYASRADPLDRPESLSAELGVSMGMGDDKGSFATDTGPGVSIGKRSAEFAVLRTALAYQWEVASGWQLQGRFTAQLSDDTQLPQQQQWVLGGIDGLAAYLPGVLVGDEGWFARVAVGRSQQWLGLAWRPGLFVEYGASEFADASGALARQQSLADAGLSLALDLPRGFATELVAATPLHEDVVDDDRRGQLEADFFWRLRWTY